MIIVYSPAVDTMGPPHCSTTYSLTILETYTYRSTTYSFLDRNTLAMHPLVTYSLAIPFRRLYGGRSLVLYGLLCEYRLLTPFLYLIIPFFRTNADAA
jgi:hypothetical protein